MTALVDTSTAVLAAAVAALTEAGVTPGPRRYVSVRGGDWVPTRDCADCCDQLVVIPREVAPQIAIAAVTAPQPIPAGSTRLARFEVLWSTGVNVDPGAGRLKLGDATLPWGDLSQQGTHWAEAGLILTVMDTLTRQLPKRTSAELCASANMPTRACKLVSASTWIEGGCGGCRVTIEVAL